MSRIGIALTLIFFISLVFLEGCVKRDLLIRSDPPGATVYFDDRKIGATPENYDFVWYAKHKIRLEKEGYEAVDEIISLRMPRYLWIPLDLIFEMIPYTFWDRREVSFKLKPLE